MERGKFTQNTSLAIVGSSSFPYLTMAQKNEDLKSLGVALFTVPMSLS
jgi:hypothetical protein